jgi:hypothetical protein
VKIDKIVDLATGCEMMVLLDCFSGYHQIWLHKEGMCNAGRTFYRMMKASLKDQIGKNVLSYVDDIVIASKKDDYISDLVETFTNMREAWLKLTQKMHIQDYEG